MKATAKDLRFRTRQLLEAVDRGESVIITYRGKPRAKLVAVAGEKRRRAAADTPGFGLWRHNRRVKDVEGFVDRLRRPRFE